MLVLLFSASCIKQPVETPAVPSPNQASAPASSSEPTPSSTQPPSPTLTPTPIAVTASPLPAHGFVVGDKPFQFLGANVNQHYKNWSKATNDDLVRSAKTNGITVLRMLTPWFENPLGNYDENALANLDHLLETARQNGVYVVLPFIHAWGISLSPEDPYYHPGGIEGLVKNQELKEAFKKRIARLVTRVNTVNGRKYSEDPTILAWMLVEEILSAPENYSKGAPKVTAAELADWVEEMASYVKSLDANHLVTMNVHSGIAKVGDNWAKMLTVPSLDFIEVEDAEARFLQVTQERVDFYLEVFTLEKPVVMMISFTGGALSKLGIENDYIWQSDKLKGIFKVYYQMGVAAGVTIYQWASDLSMDYRKEPYIYTASNNVMAQAFVDIAATLGPRNSTTIPLQFVKVSSK